MPNPRPSNRGFLAKAHSFLVFGGGVYVFALTLLALPYFQRHLIYLHAIQFPFFPKFDQPTKYGLAPFKTLNLNLTTSDNVRIGAWFVFSDRYYQWHATHPIRAAPFTDSELKEAVSKHPTVIFFHGNAANRAAPYRVTLYSQLSTRLGASVLAIDYRGFGNSDGSPSPEGLALDARAAWNWLLKRGAKPKDIVIMGHSIGTGVAARLAADLAAEGTSSRALVLTAPFSSVATLMETYSVGGFIPVMRPLLTFPFVFKFWIRFLRHKFDTVSILPSVSSPILLVHAKDDDTIPSTHSDFLFNTLLEPLLPAQPFTPQEMASPLQLSAKDWTLIHDTEAKRNEARVKLVKTWNVDGFGSVSIMERPSKGNVAQVTTHSGSHVKLLGSEGVLDMIAKVANIQRS